MQWHSNTSRSVIIELSTFHPSCVQRYASVGGVGGAFHHVWVLEGRCFTHKYNRIVTQFDITPTPLTFLLVIWIFSELTFTVKKQYY